MSPLTRRQQEVLDFIERFRKRAGYPPTQAEIAANFGFTQKAAADHLKLIKKKGVISTQRDVPRSIRLIDSNRREFVEQSLPLIGRVAAGPPLFGGDDVDEFVPIAPTLFRPQADYLRRVKGQSMQDMGIFTGDLIGIRAQATAENGDIVVAKLFRGPEAEITVKQFQRRGDVVQLIAKHPDYKPIVVDLQSEQFEIEGLYCGHFHAHT